MPVTYPDNVVCVKFDVFPTDPHGVAAKPEIPELFRACMPSRGESPAPLVRLRNPLPGHLAGRAGIFEHIKSIESLHWRNPLPGHLGGRAGVFEHINSIESLPWRR